jgi:thiol:disulfide interchange protein
VRILALLILLAACNQRTLSEDPAQLEWAPTEEAAFQRAAVLHRGVIAFEVARWSIPATAMDRLFRSADTQSALGGWVAYPVDVTDGDDAASAWQARHDVKGVPFVGFYRADGTELARITQHVERDELMRQVPALR